MNDEYWMQQALALAEKAAALGEVPVGAVVVKDGLIVGRGYNCPISQADPSAHAEIQALKDAAKTLNNYRLTGCELFVTIEPCTMCTGAMIHSRIQRLVYGALEPKAGVIESQAQLLSADFFNHTIESQGGVCAEQSAQLLKQFFANRREQKKRESRDRSAKK